MRVASFVMMVLGGASSCEAAWARFGVQFIPWWEPYNKPSRADTNDQLCVHGHRESTPDDPDTGIINCYWWHNSYYRYTMFDDIDIYKNIYIQIGGSDALWATQFWAYDGIHWREWGQYSLFGKCMSTDPNDYLGDGWYYHVPDRSCYKTLKLDPEGRVWGYHHYHMDIWNIYFAGRRLEKEVNIEDMSIEELDAVPESNWVLLTGETSKTSNSVPPASAVRDIEGDWLADGFSVDRSMVPPAPAFKDVEAASLEAGNSAEENTPDRAVEVPDDALPEVDEFGETASSLEDYMSKATKGN